MSQSSVKKMNVIVKGIVNITAIVGLTIYGIKLAEMGINHTTSMLIGLLIGMISGANVKGLKELLS